MRLEKIGTVVRLPNGESGTVKRTAGSQSVQIQRDGGGTTWVTIGSYEIVSVPE